MTSKEKLAFISDIRTDWEIAIEEFFIAVERKRVQKGLTEADVTEALVRGYGWEIANEWDDWAGEE